MKLPTAYSVLCAGFTGTVALLALAGCFSERVAGTAPPDENLCEVVRPNVVRISDFAFATPQLTVSAGTEVTWVNCDEVAHTSTADAGAWSSRLLAPGATFRRTFAAAGTFAYHCDPHPGMRATIVVQ